MCTLKLGLVASAIRVRLQGFLPVSFLDLSRVRGAPRQAQHLVVVPAHCARRCCGDEGEEGGAASGGV